VDYFLDAEGGFSSDWLANQSQEGSQRIIAGQAGTYQSTSAQQPPPHPAFMDMEDEEREYTP
jgi:hypothetical protein